MMRNFANLILRLSLAAPLVGPAFAADYIDQRGAAPIHGDPAAGAAKATVCVACHGPNGNAIVPMFPRLAGQRADYLYWELVKFKRGTRPQSPMTAQVADLGDEDMRNLAVYFAAQTVTPSAATATTTDTSAGQSLFLSGKSTANVPPCQGCHGANAEGIAGADFVAWPALRGQHADYLVQRLKDYRDAKLTDSSNDFIMQGVASTLDDASIQALAAYLAALPPSSR